MESRTVTLPAPGFALEAVKRAAYVLMPTLSVTFAVTSELITCELTPANPDVDMVRAERDFRREVLDQDLRLSIEAKTAPIREAILGLAFSRTGLQDG
ncbi:hypothetical protein [Novosphingobium sp.]|uniref:hypothetical protein n=1 Tax=Novosphingobium sp. TaxID=1874826 RepID=UPI0038B7D168